ncbi:hypothetical protein VTN49DRAFT_6493 [Thermomyces lanuginosus]|uniref:uncharacterized protein n=1 Tax=Thermomyces lanuginosus TaxID=5541 RepID=UPI0037422BCC
MSNVCSIAWRTCPPGLRVGFTPTTTLGLMSRARQATIFQRSCHFLSPSQSPRWTTTTLLRPPHKNQATPTILRLCRYASSNSNSPERGVPIRSEPLSASEIKAIFGPTANISPQMGNRVLAVLQGRRLAGTLDQPLPADIRRTVPSRTIERGLQWLRENHPVDEDAAIMARIEREEREEEERLLKHAEEMGMLHPQSGYWGAQLGQQGDVYGRSVFKETRERNEKRLLEEAERERKEWLEGELKDREKIQRQQMQLQKHMELAEYNPSEVVEARPRADPKERPFLAWAQKHYIRAENNDADFSQVTTAQRIFPSLLVSLVTLTLAYLFASNYEEPTVYDRLWPQLSMTTTTIGALAGVNVAIWLLWKFPPAWRTLNRYFISVPLYPYALSAVGSVFSHQALKHLATNMAILWLIGSRLHDEVSRGDFLALYVSAGVVGSMTSLTAHVLLKKLTITSLGASGAIAGLVGAWCTLHANDLLTPSFLPESYRNTFSASGSTVLAGIILFEVLNLLAPAKWKMARLDHWAHLGGYVAGAVWARSYHSNKKKRERESVKRNLWDVFK